MTKWSTSGFYQTKNNKSVFYVCEDNQTQSGSGDGSGQLRSSSRYQVYYHLLTKQYTMIGNKTFVRTKQLCKALSSLAYLLKADLSRSKQNSAELSTGSNSLNSNFLDSSLSTCTRIFQSQISALTVAQLSDSDPSV
jgi:hypothetical protein